MSTTTTHEPRLSLDQSSTSSPDKEQTADLTKTETHEYPPKAKAAVIIAAVYIVLFLTALDRLIIGVAIPSITDEFNSLGDVGWYGSAYLLTSAAFMLLLGRIYTIYHPKWVYLSALVVFEIGSAVCGAAPNSDVLIVGRAIAGLGSAGLFQGAMIVIVYIIPLHQRPQLMGFAGLVFGVASAIGPLLGGAFTDGPGWRWCFYINLPCGAVVIAMLVFFLHIPPGMLTTKPATFKELVTRLDPIGTLCFLPSVICLLLALQWGGVTYSWSDGLIIALLVIAIVLFIGFLIVQKWKGENATVPGRVFFHRSIVAGASFTFFTGGAMQTMFYFLPIWFQAIKGASALKSGIMNLPMVLGLVITSVMAGILTKKIGYYAPWMIVSAILMPIGAGLISTFTPETGHAKWIGYQALFGLGVGFGMQQPSVAAQTSLPRKDVAIGASLMMFCQTIGGAIFISVGNNIFDSRLASDLMRIPSINVGSVVDTGATALRQMVPTDELPPVLSAYNDALRLTFYMVVILTCLAIFGAATMEWKSVKKGQQEKAKVAEKPEQQV